MKYIIFASLFSFSALAASTSSSLTCSNSSGSVKYFVTEGYGPEMDKKLLTIVKGNMEGEMKLSFKAHEISILQENDKLLETDLKSYDTGCGKKGHTASSKFAVHFTIKKVDGSEFLEGDLPATDADKVIKDYLICSEKQNYWPCDN